MPVPLAAAIVDLGDLTAGDRDAMAALYLRHYDGVDRAQFEADLADKQHVVLVRGPDGRLTGFSTVAVLDRRVAGRPLRAIFSGDTVIDRADWGQQAFAFAWLRLAGSIAARDPGLPLWWFLIVKGHRTYRYLPTFARVFHPARDRPTPPTTQALMDALAGERFGGAYDPARGIVSFGGGRGRLAPDLAPVPDKDRDRPEVQYFLARNPGYTQGDELVCLCRLAPDNLQPLARRVFLSGMSGAERERAA
jgi:hypothetical protein